MVDSALAYSSPLKIGLGFKFDTKSKVCQVEEICSLEIVKKVGDGGLERGQGELGQLGVLARLKAVIRGSE